MAFSNDPRAWHILSICLFPVIDALGIALSVVLSARSGKNRFLLSVGAIFSAGILLSSSLVHQLPESAESLDEYFASEDVQGEEEEESFPWAYVIFGIAFLFLLSVEAVMERFIDSYFGDMEGVFTGHDHHVDHGHHHHHHRDKDGQATTKKAVRAQESTEPQESITAATNKSGAPLTVSQTNATNNDGEPALVSSSTTSTTNQTLRSRRHTSNTQTSIRSSASGSSAWTKFAPRPSVVSYMVTDPRQSNRHVLDMNTKINDEEEEEEHHHHFEEEEKLECTQQTINPWVSILLTIVLSIHVIFEGLTLGSSQDVDDIESTFIAVVAHKGFAAFSLGSSLVTSGYWTPGRKTMFFILAGVYISMDIVGLGIGMGLGEAFEDSGLASGVLKALLGGSFLFVAAVELIPGEFEAMRVQNLPLLPLLLSLATGFALMSVLAKWL